MSKPRGLLGLFTGFEAAGGIQRANRHMAAVLAGLATKQNAQCRFLSLNDPLGGRRDSVGGREFAFRGFARSKRRFALAARAGAAPVGFVLAAHPHLAPVGWVAAKKFGAPMAVVGWGIDVWEPLPLLRRWAVQRAEIAIAISQFTADQMTRLQGVKPERIRLLPLALEPSFWAAAQEGQSGAPPKGFPQGRVLLSVTRLAAAEGYKGVDTVIEALPRIAARVPAVQYVVIGDGDDRPRLEKLSRDLNVGDRVHFLGKFSSLSPELMAYYANCDVFVLPSKGEGFGIVFLEAMAFGKPVVGGAHGGTPDVIEEGRTGFLVPHGDAARLAEVLESLLTNPARCREIGEQARQRVESSFLFEHFEARLAAIVEDVCAS